MASETTGSRRVRPSRRTVARVGLVGFVVLIGWLAVGVVMLLRAASSAGEARDGLKQLRVEVTAAALLDGSVEADLRLIRADLARARTAATSPATLLLRPLPGLGRQVASAESLSAAGIEVIDVGIDSLTRISALVDDELPSGPARIEVFDEFIQVAVEGRARLQDIDLGPEERLIGSLASARDAAARGVTDVTEALDDAESIVTALRALVGDGSHLLLAANNSEMRTGSGMFLQVGLLDATAGEIDIELEQSRLLQLPEGAVAVESETYDERWGWLQPARDFRNLALSPRFDVTAALAADMWEARGNPAVDGVLAVDPFFLRVLLQATGPVVVDGQRVGAENVLQYLFHDQYEGVAGELELQNERREALAGIVEAAIAALDRGGVDPAALLEGLQEAARGRHILAWSPSADIQRGWAAAGADGTVTDHSVMVSLANRGANKLDPFVLVNAVMEFERSGDEPVEVTMRIRIENTVPDGEGQYVAGPASDVDATTTYGDYFAVLTVNLPGTARNVRFVDDGDLEVAGPDGPLTTVGKTILIRQGKEQIHRLRFELPADLEMLRFEPSSRPVAVNWRVGNKQFTDEVVRMQRVPGVAG